MLAGCGGGGDSTAVFVRAQDGLGRIRSGSVSTHLTVHALVPIERSAEFPATAFPLSKLHLTRWIEHPRRLACASGLECARADLDVKAALRDLDSLLPSLPVDPASIHSARVDVAVSRVGRLPRWLRLHGEVDPGGLFPGTVPFDLDVSLNRVRAG